LISPIAIFGIVFFVLYLRQEGIRTGRAVGLLLLVAVAAFLGAKLFSLYVRDWELYSPLSAEWRGGLRYPGAMLAMLLLGPLLQRWLLPELPLLHRGAVFTVLLPQLRARQPGVVSASPAATACFRVTS
jgi:prolipoprotein diacylglyceryltransferase